MCDAKIQLHCCSGTICQGSIFRLIYLISTELLWVYKSDLVDWDLLGQALIKCLKKSVYQCLIPSIGKISNLWSEMLILINVKSYEVKKLSI